MSLYRRFAAIVLGILCTGISYHIGAATPSSSSPGDSPRWVIGVSPFLEDSEKDAVFRRIVGFILEEMPLGSSLQLYDAYHLQSITSLTIPDSKAFRSARTRATQFQDAVQKLRRFMAASPARPAGGATEWNNAIRLPQFMDFLAGQRTNRVSMTVLLLGSPLYMDPKEPGFSMVDGFFPSDGHLRAGREDSVFGLQERVGRLEDMQVCLGYFGDPWVSHVHEEKVNRFWSLFLEGQGGALRVMSGDLTTVFQAGLTPSRGDAPAVPRYERDPAQTKISMLRIHRNVGEMDWITREAIPHAALTPPETTVGPMKIGIRWQGNIDLDLYAAPRSDAETLFFQHTRSPEGYYFKDHRSSPRGEYEFIEFQVPVDVNNVEARINYYQGESDEGPVGEVRIEYGGQVYTGNFRLDARHGNEGRSGGRQSAYWTRIDVPAVLRLASKPSR